MTVCERMFKTMDEKGLMAADLCRVIGAGTSQTTGWKKRGADPPAKYLMQIAAFLDVSIEWLLTGEGNDHMTLTQDELDMLRAFRSLNPRQQQRVIGIVEERAGLIEEAASEQEQVS